MSERCHGEHLTSPSKIHPRSTGYQPAKAGRLVRSYKSSSSAPAEAVYMYGGGEGAGGTEERSNVGIGEGDGHGGSGDVRSNAATKAEGGCPSWVGREASHLQRLGPRIICEGFVRAGGRDASLTPKTREAAHSGPDRAGLLAQKSFVRDS